MPQLCQREATPRKGERIAPAAGPTNRCLHKKRPGHFARYGAVVLSRMIGIVCFSLTSFAPREMSRYELIHPSSARPSSLPPSFPLRVKKRITKSVSFECTTGLLGWFLMSNVIFMLYLTKQEQRQLLFCFSLLPSGEVPILLVQLLLSVFVVFDDILVINMP